MKEHGKRAIHGDMFELEIMFEWDMEGEGGVIWVPTPNNNISSKL